MDSQGRQRWTEQRTRKEPTLYDEWLSEERRQDSPGISDTAAAASSTASPIYSSKASSSAATAVHQGEAYRSGNTAEISQFTPGVVSERALHSREELGNLSRDYTSDASQSASSVAAATSASTGLSNASKGVRSFVRSITPTTSANSSTPHSATAQHSSRTTMDQPSPVGSFTSSKARQERANSTAGIALTSRELAVRSDGRKASPNGNGTLVRRLSKQHNSSAAQSLRSSAREEKHIFKSSRARTRTLDERSNSDHSPSRGSQRQRNRTGSVDTTASLAQSANASPSSASVQTLPKTKVTSFSSPLQQPLYRQQQAPDDAANAPVQSSGIDAAVSSDMSNALSRRIQQLMRQLHGRMSGEVVYRRGPDGPWRRTQCYIQENTSSLIYDAQERGQPSVLISDLRGVHVEFRAEQQVPFIVLRVPSSSQEAHLRLYNQNDFDSWLAALLTWHHRGQNSYRPQQVPPASVTATSNAAIPQIPRRSSAARSNSPHSRNRANSDRLQNRRKSAVMSMKEAPVIKIGKMIYWDTDFSFTATTASLVGQPASVRPQPHRMQSYGSRRWRRISAQLRENGELKLHADADNSLLSVVQLSQLSRCAIQRLDASVLGNEYCIAVYPQYTSTSADGTAVLRPIFLSVESRVLHEVWFVLLRAFTIPQLYGTQIASENRNEETNLDQRIAHSTAGMFRMERALSIRVVEAKLTPSIPKDTGGHHSRHQHHAHPEKFGYHVEVLLDNETRAKTAIKAEGLNPLWGETFEFSDLPSVLTSASVVIKRRPPDSMRTLTDGRPAHEAYGFSNDAHGGFSAIKFDVTVGKVEIYFDEIAAHPELEKWWPVVNMFDQQVGEVLIKARAEEGVVMMAHDYDPVSELLHRFSNGLTLQLAQIVPNELKKLSDCLLDIFQVSGKAGEWIMSLIEDEIDSVNKDTPISRLRYNNRAGQSESVDSHGYGSVNSDRELFVRDMNKHATLEANLLFRGNTLLTKSLDSHMRRVGKDFLEEALSAQLQEICTRDPDCEVDPNRTTDSEIGRNWRRLIMLTQEIWGSIMAAKQKCPIELRRIFRHVRACAEDRYGDFMRSVSYSSVSGFLFLRFFCPAILNPKLFGLFKDDIKPRARRTLTLVAKSLQTLANMASFGNKEQWMEPMNIFLNRSRAEFKTFIDDICYVPVPMSTRIASPTSPVAAMPQNNIVSADTHLSYTTPMTIMQRLPPTSREGFPSLPYLIDQPRAFAELVTLWLDTTSDTSPARVMAFPGRSKADLLSAIRESEGEVKAFHEACMTLQAKTQQRLNQAERAERPSSALSFQWEELIDQLQSPADDHDLDAQFAASSFHGRSQHVASAAHDVSTLPQTSELERAMGAVQSPERTTDSPASSSFEPFATTPTPDNGDDGYGLRLDTSAAVPHRNQTIIQARAMPLSRASDVATSPVSGGEVSNFSSSTVSSDNEHARGTTALPSYDRELRMRLREHDEQRLRSTGGRQPAADRDGEHGSRDPEKAKKQGRKFVPVLRKKKDDRERGVGHPQSP